MDERAKKQNSDTLNNAEFCVISKNRIVFNNRLAVNVKRLFRLPFLSAFFNKSGLIDCQTFKNRAVADFAFCNSPASFSTQNGLAEENRKCDIAIIGESIDEDKIS